MNGLPYYKAYPRDFIEGTIGMDFELKAAYRLVLDLVYMQGGRLVDDARYISGLLGCSVKRWNGLRSALIAADKLQVSDGYLGNYRADKELEILGKFQDKQRENRSRPNKNNDLQSPPTNHTEPDTEVKEEANASSKKAASKKVSEKRQSTRIPADWTLPKSWGEWAVSAEGFSPADVRREADKFFDYWTAAPTSKACKSDWQATWRGWIRKAADDRRKHHPARQSTGDFGAFGRIREVG